MPDNEYPPQGGQGWPTDPNHRGPDEYTKWVQLQRLNNGPQDVAVGNFADLQRAGADKTQGVSNTTSDKAIAAPPGYDLKDDNVISPAQLEASRGEWTRETERVGLLGSPPQDQGGDGHAESVVVDPTSTSPKVESEPKGNQAQSQSQSQSPGSSTIKK